MLAALVLQISEIAMVVNVWGMVRRGELSIKEVLMEELVYGYTHWMFWGPLSLSLVVGYFLPHWFSYFVLLGLTVLAGSNILTFTLNVLGSLGYGSNNSKTPGEEKQNEGDNEQNSYQNQKSDKTAGMD